MNKTSLHIQTPLFDSLPISQRIGKSVFLKMDCFQPAGSFKLRGMGYICQQAAEAGKSHLICSSGGNAGFATAYAGRMLGVPVTIVVPQTTAESVRQKIMSQGANVIVRGTVWDEAHQFALGLTERLDGAYVHPFDNPKSWYAHATMIDEVVEQCAKPDMVILSVGGGGLLCGVIEGLHRNGWQDVPVVAVETEGAASLAATLKAGKLVTLPQINTIATTLGAKQVTAKALEWSKAHTIIPVTVTDAQAIEACRLFANHHRALVEPACGAALAIVYQNADVIQKAQSILVIVCGGVGISLDKLAEWEKNYDSKGSLGDECL